MSCTACGTDLPAGARFCHACGTVQTVPPCSSCNSELLPGASFCSTCGTPTGMAPPPLPADGRSTSATVPAPSGAASERRLTSVLFADLVSYTTLSETRDTEDVRDLLTKYFEVCSTIVRRYGGTVEKFIGDAVMAVWGVPSAHEDDAERAVRAALELVASVAALGETLGISDLALRAGVVTGEVSTTVGATDQGMVAGDPVNTAARVQSAAAPGEVWVDANTRALTAAAVTYTDAGEHVLKGKAEAMRLFRAGSVVAALGGQQRVDGLEAPLVGRERELRLLKELFHGTEESGRPRLVVLDGDAGVGKSRLAWEFDKYSDGLSRTVKWHRGRCLSYGDGVAYWALAEAVRARFGVIDDNPETDLSDAIDLGLAEHVDDPDERAWMRPRLASLLGEGYNEFQREDLYSAWTRFFERVGRTDPVVLVIDDAQYADAGLLDFLEYLLSGARAGIFVLLLSRPELMAARPDLGGRRSTVIRLEPLTDTQMGSLIDGLVDGLPATARAALVERAEGVPLYAVETVRALIDRDMVQPSEGRYVVAPGKELDISSVAAPPSLHALVAARLDALTANERRVVNDASVLGMTFTREGIGVLCPGVADLDQVLTTLQRKEIIATETDRFSAERGQYRFVQAVVQQVAYSTLSRRDRKSRHLAVTQHLSNQTDRADELAVVIAQHLVDAVNSSAADDADVAELGRRAADLLGKAAARACSLGSFVDGLRLYQAAISRVGEGTARVALEEQAAEAAGALGQWDLADQLASSALQAWDAAGDPVAAAPALVTKTRALSNKGEVHAALALIRPRYEALLEVADSESARLKLSLILGRTLVSLGEWDQVRSIQGESLRLAGKLDEPEALALAMNLMALEQMAAGADRVAFALWRDVAELSREQGMWERMVLAHANLGVFSLPYSCTEGIRHTETALSEAQQHGFLGMAGLAYANLSAAYWTAGRWDQLQTILTEYDERSGDTDPSSLSILVNIELWREEAGLARIISTEASYVSEDHNTMSWNEHLQMVAEMRARNPSAAATHAKATVELAIESSGFQDDFMHIWPRAVRVAIAAGDLNLAAELVAIVGDAAPGDVTPVLRAHLQVLRGALGAAGGGTPEDVEANLLGGIAAFGSYGSPPLIAQAQEDLGRWLIAQDRHSEAQSFLEAARAAYQALGATAWLHRIELLLPALSREAAT